MKITRIVNPVYTYFHSTVESFNTFRDKVNSWFILIRWFTVLFAHVEGLEPGGILFG